MKIARMVSALFLFLALAIQVGVRIEVTKKTYSIEKLRKAALHNDILLRDRKLSYAWLTNPAEIGRRASQGLGMIVPEPESVIRIGSN